MRNYKNQNKIPTFTSNTDKIVESNIEALNKLRRDYPCNPVIEYLNINFIRNKIVQFSDVCKTSLVKMKCNCINVIK